MYSRPARFVLLATIPALLLDSLHADGGSDGSFIAGPDLPLEPFHGIDAVDLDGNLTPEVVVLRGSSLIVYPDPDINDTYVVVAEDALSFAAGSKDDGPVLVFTSPAGLFSVAFEEQAYTVELLSDSTLWRSASTVRVDDKEGLVGVDLLQHTFFFSEFTGSGAGLPQVLFTLGPAMRDVRLLDWDGVGTREIAILTSNGLQLRSRSGAVFFARGALVPGDAIAVVRSSPQSDGLAWVTRNNSGQALLLLFHFSFAGAYQGPTALGSEVFASASSADIDGDGDGDLVLARTSTSTIDIVENRSAPGTWTPPSPPSGAFGAGISAQIDLGLGADSPASGQVLCANLFNDHDSAGVLIPGYAMALASPSGLRLRPRPGIRANFAPPSADFSALEFDSALSLAGCPSVPTSQGPNSLWTLLPSGGWGNVSGATHLEVIVRMSPAPQLAPLQTATHHLMFPLSANGIPETPVAFTGNETPLSPENSSRCYFAGVRPVRLNAQGTNILEAWRWSVIGMSAHCDGLDWMAGMTIALGLSVPYQRMGTCGDPGELMPCGQLLMLGGSRYLPTGVPVTKFPSSGPGVMPIVYPWSY